MRELIQKDPNAHLDYERDWTPWLAADEDTIVTSTWIVPAGMTMTSESHTTTTATVWLSGGTVGESYTVVNRITTAAGRIDDRSWQFVIRDR
jgi:hypothetical protein